MTTKNGIPILTKSFVRGCDNKKCYTTFGKADLIIRKIKESMPDEDHTTLASYRCSKCNSIHIGHSTFRSLLCSTNSNGGS